MQKYLWLLAASLAACAPATDAIDDDSSPSSTSESIIHGHADSADPAVVAIDIGGEGLCTGALIAPRWVLTARHCVSETVEGIDCPSWEPQIFADRDAESLTILVGSDVTTAKPVALGSRLVVPATDELCSNDIALIQLDRAVSGVKPLAVGFDNQPPLGSYVRAVGFGKRGQKTGAGKKYARDHVRVLDRSASEFMVGEATCNGDSGGPALDSSGAVVGVVSRGGPGCTGSGTTNIYTRTSAFATFIKRAISH